MKNLNIIILHYGGVDVTKKCIQSIINKKIEFKKIFLVDNQGNFPYPRSEKVILIKKGKNLGYAGGMNLGIVNSLKENSDFILLINNDIEFVDSSINNFNKYFTSNIKILSPSLRFQKNDDILYDLGGYLDPFGVPKHRNLKELPNLQITRTRFVSGACMLIRSEVFKDVGFFDERFFLYFEDVDFCSRAEKKGIGSAIILESFVKHELSKTVGEESKMALYHQARSGVMYSLKYHRFIFFIEHILITTKRIIKNPKVAKAGVFGIFDGFTNKLAAAMVS